MDVLQVFPARPDSGRRRPESRLAGQFGGHDFWRGNRIMNTTFNALLRGALRTRESSRNE